MPLVTSKEMLLKAQKGGYAVGAFNAENMEMVKAIIQAAEELKAPVMIQTTPSTIKYGTVETYAAIVAAEAAKASVPVCLHLDHGSSFELAMQAMHAGYTSVMIDGSKLDFEDNTFDVVGIGNSLHHIPDLAALLAEMKRVVKPGGLIILSEMYNDGQPKASLTHWILHDVDCTMHTIDGIYHHPTYSKSEILWLARNAGLTVEKTLCDLIDDPKVVAKLRERIAAVPENLKKYESNPAHAFLAAEAAWLNEEYEANGVTSAEQLVAFCRK